MSAWLDPYAVLLAVAFAAAVAFVWWRWGPAAGVASLVSGLGILWGLVSLWRTFKPMPERKDPPKNPFSDAERERVRADIERHHKATQESAKAIEHAMDAETPDEQSARLVAMPRRPVRAAPTMPPDDTPATPRKRR